MQVLYHQIISVFLWSQPMHNSLAECCLNKILSIGTYFYLDTFAIALTIIASNISKLIFIFRDPQADHHTPSFSFTALELPSPSATAG